MKIERLLQINIAVMATMGTLLFGIGQPIPSLTLPLIAGFVAFTAVIFTDVLKWFYLNRFVANGLALAVAAYTMYRFFLAETSGEKLLEIATLLAYLQLILFYEVKGSRAYSHLMVLSLLQVVVAAALHLNLTAGAILLVYVIVAIGAMALYYLYREQLRIDQQRRAAAAQIDAGSSRSIVAFAEANDVFGGTMSVRTIVPHVTAMVVSAFCITIIVFYTLPRRTPKVWQGADGGGAPVMGFHQRVEFGESHLIEDSEKNVMRVSFVDQKTLEPYVIIGEPYFRGAVLTEYRDAAWHAMNEDNPRNLVDLMPASPQTDQVRQTVVLSPNDDMIVFSVFPCYAVSPSKNIRFDLSRRQLVRAGDSEGRIRSLRYTLATTAFHNGIQRPATAYAEVSRGMGDSYKSIETGHLRRFDQRRFPQLSATAENVLAEQQTDRDDSLAVALALHSFLQNSSDFRYTLDFRNVERDQQLDPIEDFVANHHQGHCEYFASALAMMLRSQNIPARLVVGYKGGEFNPLGNFYQVQEKHVHAWVEAYVEPKKLPKEMKILGDASQGVWLRLDPTPGIGAGESEDFEANFFTQFGQMMDYCQLLWSDYVLGYNSDRKEETIFRNLNQDTPDKVANVFTPSNPEPAVVQVAELAPPNYDDPHAKYLRTIWIGVVAVTLLWVVAWLVWVGVFYPRFFIETRIGRLLIVWWAPLSGLIGRLFGKTTSQRVGQRIGVDFYKRFVNLVGRYGLHREGRQTHREFAQHIVRDFLARGLHGVPAVENGGTSGQGLELARLPNKIVEAYYEVRFGKRQLSQLEQAEIETAITSMETALKIATSK